MTTKKPLFTPAARRRLAEIHATIACLRREQARLARLGRAVLLILLFGASALPAKGSTVASWYFYSPQWPAFDPIQNGLAVDWWMLADSLPSASLGPWLQNLLYVFGVIFFLLGGIEKWKSVLGRHPALEDTLIALRTRIEQAATAAEVGALRTRIEQHATAADIHALHEQIIPKEKITGDIESLTEEIAQVKEEVKEGSHLVGEKLDAMQRQITERFDALDKKRSVSIANLHAQVNTTNVKIAGVESTVTSLTQGQHAMSAKLDRLQENRK